MAIQTSIHNVKDGLGDPFRCEELVDTTLDRNPDVAVFLEAYSEHKQGLVPDVVNVFEVAGYTVTHGLYDDEDDRMDRHGIMMLVKDELVPAASPGDLIRLGTRNGIKATVQEPGSDPIEMLAFHMDDRSEEKQMGMLADLPKHVELDDDGKLANPTVATIALNSLCTERHISRALRLARPFFGVLPHADPNPVVPPPTWPYRFGLAYRFSGFAGGQAIKHFDEMGFAASDLYEKPTIPAARPFVQLDDILVSKHIDPKWYEISRRIYSANHRLYFPHSDHRRLTTSFALKKTQ